MRIALAAAVALAPLAAGAITLSVNGQPQEVRVGTATCKTLELNARWDIGQAPAGNDNIRLIGAASGSNSCNSTDKPTPPDEVFVDKPPDAQIEFFNVSAREMTLTHPDGGVDPCDDPGLATRSAGNPLKNTLCAQYTVTGLVTGGLATSSVTISYAFAPPQRPVNVSTTPGDSHFKVSWTAGDVTELIANYDVHVFPEGGTPGTPTEAGSGNIIDVDHSDDGKPLVNDQRYEVTVVATDGWGNVSPPSDTAIGVPVATEDFFNHYRNLGGAGKGCESASPSALVAVAALLAGFAARRRAAAAVVAVLLIAPAARAEDPAKRRFLLGFKLDRYDPKVDSEEGLTGSPYHDVFGTRAPPRFQVEFDWQVAHPFGAILVGVTGGFWQNFGKAILTKPAGDTSPPQPSQDTTLLNVIPFGAIATWRFDLLADRYRWCPVIPYAQAGLMRALWISYNGVGKVSSDKATGEKGQGWSYGYTAALGVAVSLNAIDPDLANEGARDAGIERTAAFAEYGWTFLDRGSSMVLNDRAWRFGISVEF